MYFEVIYNLSSFLQENNITNSLDICYSYSRLLDGSYLSKNQILTRISSDYIESIIGWGHDEIAEPQTFRFAYASFFNPNGKNLLPKIYSLINEEETEDILEKIESLNHFWQKNMDYAEEFYQNNKKLYAEMTEKVNRIDQKQKKLKIY